MAGLPIELVSRLQRECGLSRAVETGTYLGGGTRELARIFEKVVTVELSEALTARAQEWLPDVPNITLLNQDSRDALMTLVRENIPSLYFLDGHWSGGPTAGEESECPVLAEVEALTNGHTSDCIIIDDARLFACPPPAPHDASQWPTLIELVDALRQLGEERHTTLVGDHVISVPTEAKAIVDQWGTAVLAAPYETQPDDPPSVATIPLSRRLGRWRDGG